MNTEHLLAYFGHHKSASTWIHNIVGNVCDEAGWRCDYLANPEMFDEDLPAYVARSNTDFLCYVNANFSHVNQLEMPFRGFHVIRDPRDILTSAYFSHLHSHKTDAWPELIEHRKRLQAASKDEGLLLEMDFNADVMEDMLTWNYHQECVLELKMEDFTTDPLNGWLSVFRHLDIIDESHHGKRAQAKYLLASATNVLHRHGRIPVARRMRALPVERLLGIVYNNRFETKTSGRDAGKEDVQSHYRKGVSGDWRNHFTRQHVSAFKDRYNELLLKLGYEADPDWI